MQYSVDKIENMTKEEIKVMLNEFDEVLRDKDTQIENLNNKIGRQNDREIGLQKKINMLQAMIQGIVDNEF